MLGEVLGGGAVRPISDITNDGNLSAPYPQYIDKGLWKVDISSSSKFDFDFRFGFLSKN